MADEFMTEQDEATTLADADIALVTVDVAGTPLSKYITWANIKALIITALGGLINGLTSKATPVDADYFVIGDSAASNASKKLTLANLKPAIKTYIDLYFRERLAANRTYYVRADGSDSNTGLVNTAGGAFLTIQKAINVVAALDISTYDVTIQVADGTYTGTVTVTGAWLGSGTVTLLGNTTTPANVVLSTTGSCITVQDGGRLTISGLKLASSAGACIWAKSGGSIIQGAKIEYSTSGFVHIYASVGGRVICGVAYTINGGAGAHYQAESGASIQFTSMTVTVSGTPAFSTAFASAVRSGIVEAYGQTFSGSATGARYTVTTLGNIFVNGGGANYFPGNSAGSTATGGQYN